jgi:hypothetical protein
MFTDNPNFQQVAEQIWIWRNFVTKEENKKIMELIHSHEIKFKNSEDAFVYGGHEVEWYRDKTGPILVELKPIWDRISAELYPEHYIHPQLNTTVMRPGDEGMFIHSDSPGMNMEHHLTQLDRWGTCCRLSYGLVTYFGEYTDGQIFYPNIEKDSTPKNRPGDVFDCLEIDVKPGDLVIHGAMGPWEHGVREITSGVRYAYSNFCMEKQHAPGTFELFNPDKHPYMSDPKEIVEWNQTVYPETTFCKKKCICGDSADFPYCDNTHKVVNKRKLEEDLSK